MDDSEYNLKVIDESGEPCGFKFSCRFRDYLNAVTTEQLPQYRNEFPFLRGRSSDCYYDNDIIIIVLTYELHMGATFLGTLKDQNLIDRCREFLHNNNELQYAQLKKAFGESYYSFGKFLYFDKVKNGNIPTVHFTTAIVDWLNFDVMPVIDENNRKRVLGAIPIPPRYNIDKILSNIFVLEENLDTEKNDETPTYKQGTCFFIKDIGFITCAHVLSKKMQLFHPKNPCKKYDVIVKEQNSYIDLAIVEAIEVPDTEGLSLGKCDQIQLMDHIAVAGLPNYRVGDTGILSPGLVIGFRPVHGIRRLLVNASIVSGSSGGPVFNAENNVIGVAVTGSDSMENVSSTENHGVIPIEAIQYLLHS